MKSIYVVAVLFFLFSFESQARVTRLQIFETQSPTFGGHSFAEVGSYDRVVGRYYGELDPNDPQLQVITDLGMAPRNAKGLIEYSATFFILRPTDPRRGNQTLFYDFGNRGDKYLLNQYNDAKPTNNPFQPSDAGNGFLMRQGFTLVWSGNLGDADNISDPYRVAIELPRVLNPDGSPLEDVIWDECFNDFWAREPDKTLCPLSYPVPRLNKNEVTLLVRERREDKPVEISQREWDFSVDSRGSSSNLKLKNGMFRSGLIYQVIHRAANPPAMGLGLVAVRDWISFLRHQTQDDFGQPNPLVGTVNQALAYGMSQAGRTAREFLYLGFNQDPLAQKIFEGVTILGATNRTFLNFRFAQPRRAADFQHEAIYYPNANFPYGFQEESDPLSGKSDGIFRRCQQTQTCPKIISAAGSSDYWQLRSSLVTTTPDGLYDAVLPDQVRVYFFAGIGHAPVPKGFINACEHQGLTLNFSPLLRKLIVDLRQWTKGEGVPPPSRYPRLDNGTLVQGDQYRSPWPPPALHPGRLVNPLRIYDYGADFAHGILSQILPLELNSPYRVFIPQVNADGNELAGIHLPAVSEPLATYAGWNRRARQYALGEACGIMGSEIPLPRDREGREKSGDPRLSILERYPERAIYQEAVERASQRLVEEGFILPEDKTTVASEAMAKW